MREHTLSNTGGLTYAEMGQYQSADDPSDPVGTNDPEAAAQDENGEPISNGARNIWSGNCARDRAGHGIHVGDALDIQRIVGIALLLTGIGLVILAKAVFGRPRPAGEASSRASCRGRLDRRAPPLAMCSVRRGLLAGYCSQGLGELVTSVGQLRFGVPPSAVGVCPTTSSCGLVTLRSAQRRTSPPLQAGGRRFDLGTLHQRSSRFAGLFS